jgi:hypothetical protein
MQHRLLNVRSRPLTESASRQPADTVYSSSTNVTIMFTWYSDRRPFSTRTCCSLIQMLLTSRSVWVARVIPCWIASSKLLVDVALISEILAIDMLRLLCKVVVISRRYAIPAGSGTLADDSLDGKPFLSSDASLSWSGPQLDHATQLRWPSRQCADVVAQGAQFLPEGSNFPILRQLGFIILCDAADDYFQDLKKTSGGFGVLDVFRGVMRSTLVLQAELVEVGADAKRLAFPRGEPLRAKR